MPYFCLSFYVQLYGFFIKLLSNRQAYNVNTNASKMERTNTDAIIKVCGMKFSISYVKQL